MVDAYQQRIESTDGLPIVEPTRERVDEMLRYTDRDPQDSIGEIPPMNSSATIEKIAANATMAGCKPEYFPIVQAAVEGLIRDEFNLFGVLSTTHPCWPIVMVNGPLVEELNINYGRNALGQGFRANATIGRAITQICMNIGGAVAGRSDDATTGGPHKYGLCFAENEQANPWEPLHVERGFDEGTSTVTVFATESPHNINDHVSEDASSLLTTCADTMATLGSNHFYVSSGWSEPHLNLSPEHADIVAEDGWSKLDVKRFIYDQARKPHYALRGRGMYFDYGQSSPPWANHFDIQDSHSHQMVGMCSSPDDVIVTVAGGPGKQSVTIPGFGDSASQTVPVTFEDGTAVDSVDDFVG